MNEQRAVQQDETEEVVDRVLSELGLELIRLRSGGAFRTPVLTVYVDRLGGVTVGECVEATRKLRQALLAHFGAEKRFSVSVSSPGTDRSLKTHRDFSFVVGKGLVLRYRRDEDPSVEDRVEGELTEAKEEGVSVCPYEPGGEPIVVAYDRILDARIKLPY